VLRWRLSLLMFLLYAVPGAVVPMFTLRLQELCFTPLEMAAACATQALAALAAPLAAGQVADRWWPAEQCLAVAACLAGVALWLLPGLAGAGAVFAASLAFWMLLVPSTTFATSLCFAHLKAPDRDFGRVRLWGTVGWMASGLFLGYWFREPNWLVGLADWLRPESPEGEFADVFRLAGLLAFALSAYALTLPHTPPRHRIGAWLAPLAALRLLRGRSFAVYLGCTLGLCVTLPFAMQLNPLLLKHLGVPRPWLGPTLTVGQVTEVACLALLPMILLRLGGRGTMFLGLAAWAGEMGVMALGEPTGLVVASLGLNGVCVCCFLVAGQVFVNSRARGDIRTSAQGLFTLTTGLGMLAGNLLVGWIRRHNEGAFGPTYLVAAAITAGLAVVFLIGFSEDGRGNGLGDASAKRP